MYLYMMFSDLIASPEIKFLIGYYVIAIVAVNILVDFGFILFEQMRKIRNYFIHKRKVARNKKKK
jgi:hypothetical protein